MKRKAITQLPEATIVELEEMYNAGMNAPAIAAELGLSPYIVRRVLEDRGYGGFQRPGRVTFTEDELGMMADLFRKGVAIREIAERLGRSYQVIKRQLIALGLPIVVNAPLAHEQAIEHDLALTRQIWDAWRENESIAQTARELGIAYTTVTRLLSSIGAVYRRDHRNNAAVAVLTTNPDHMRRKAAFLREVATWLEQRAEALMWFESEVGDVDR